MVCCGDGGPPWAESMTTASKPFPMWERLSLSKRSVINSRLLKRMVSPMEKPPHNKRSPLVVTVSADRNA
jgi:hypothetical protein